MSAIRTCPDHGYYDGSECPICGTRGDVVVPASRRTQLSKFLSGALRHFPEDVGLELDGNGWTDLEVLTQCTDGKYAWFDPEMLAAVVATDPKGRFERDAGRIRATYGHSVDVSLDATDGPVPDTLFHGTAPENVAAIQDEGLRPMNRQLVHLSDTVEEARAVGERHAADPVVLRIDAAGLLADGWDVAKRGECVFTIERVPPRYVGVRE